MMCEGEWVVYVCAHCSALVRGCRLQSIFRCNDAVWHRRLRRHHAWIFFVTLYTWQI